MRKSNQHGTELSAYPIPGPHEAEIWFLNCRRLTWFGGRGFTTLQRSARSEVHFVNKGNTDLRASVPL